MTSTEIGVALPQSSRLRSVIREPHLRILTEEEVMNLSSASDLEPHMQRLVAERFSPEETKLAMAAFSIMTTQHEGQQRRNGKDAAVHPGGVAYLDLLANYDLSLVQLVLDFMHDTGEDCGLKPRDVRDILTMARFPQQQATLVATGVFGMTRVKGESPATHIERLRWVDGLAKNLKIPERKSPDTRYNVLDDVRQLRTDPTSVDPTRIHKYLTGKATSTLNYAQQYAPRAPNTKLLRQSMIDCAAALHEAFPAQPKITSVNFRAPA